MKKTLQYLLLFLTTYLVFEAMSLIGLGVLSSVKGINYTPIGKISNEQKEIISRLIDGESNYFDFSPELGWTIRPNGNHHLYQSNSKGIRSNREYGARTSDSIIRIATFGDSFTHSDDVPNKATWQAQMEALEPNLEVMNFGVSGYGPGQAYLRYGIEQPMLDSDIVLIGYMTENLYRSVNTFRPFYSPNTALPLAKPRFREVNSSLLLERNPLLNSADYQALINEEDQVYDQLAENDYFAQRKYRTSKFDFSPTYRIFTVLNHSLSYKYRYAAKEIEVNGEYNTDSEAFRVTLKILENFYNDVLASGSTPVIVIFPTKVDLENISKEQPVLYMPLLNSLVDRDMRHIDLAKAFIDYADEVSTDKIHKTHFTEFGNAVVASYLVKQLGDLQ